MKKILTLSTFIALTVFMCSNIDKITDGLNSGIIDLNNLDNYANQAIPNYITRDNTPLNNPISDAGATLGRVLFYDTNLSRNNTIACASCHKQEFAFGDTAVFSTGVAGVTGRHSMRLVNNRFSDEVHFFWDERANTLEQQSTMPIQDHVEMGFSGTNGDPDFDSLIQKLSNIDYYNTLFEFTYGDTIVTQVRMRRALAQFIRSIQSFDSKYDAGIVQVNNPNQPFPNFTAEENTGKNLFQAPPQFGPNGIRIGGGAGCQGCHRGPDFNIDPNSNNNGIVGSSSGTVDPTVTKSPTLRDLLNPTGATNGQLFHTGEALTLLDVIEHYDSIVLVSGNNNLDVRLRPQGNPQQLNLTQQEKDALIAFLGTLTSSNAYTDLKWSDPFAGGSLTIVPLSTSTIEIEKIELKVYPNPFRQTFSIQYDGNEDIIYSIYNLSGQLIIQEQDYLNGSLLIDASLLNSGIYILNIRTIEGKIIGNEKIVKM